MSVNEPRSVEVVAPLGFDFLFLDNEHSLTAPSEIRDAIRTAAVFRIPVVVRVSGPSRSEIGKTLDSGAAGVVVPHVEDPTELSDVIGYTRYAPAGQRGRGPTVPWLPHIQGPDPGVWTPGVIAIVESLRGVANIDELVAVPGISAILPGPGDLSQELGGVNRDSPRLQKILAKVNRAVAGSPHGPALMAFCPGTDADYTSALRDGATAILVGSDMAFLSQACAAALRRVHEGHIDRNKY